MCGIAGVLGLTSDLRTELEYCYNGIHHRGPDGFGCVINRDLRLSSDYSFDQVLEELPEATEFFAVHTRLSIVDLTTRSLQPRSLSGNRTMLFNGEIYNYRKLAQKFNLDRGKDSDTQVLEQLLSMMPISDALKELRGMFSIAIYEHDKKQLTLARDRFGIKPLYYKKSGTQVRFASEIKALRGYNKNGYNKENSKNFLLNGLTDQSNATLFNDVYSVPASTILTFDISGMQISEELYYNVSQAEQSDEIEGVYYGALKEHLNSDAKLAFMLSGGIDSSLNVLSAHAEAPNLDLVVFSGFTADKKNDERDWSRGVAELVSAEQTFISLDCKMAEEIDDAIFYLDEPFVSLSVVGQSNIFKEAARQGFKVMISGQGADEIFAGYHNFIGPFLYEMYNRRKYKEFLRSVVGLSDSTGLGFVGVFLRFINTSMNLSKWGKLLACYIEYWRKKRIFSFSDIASIDSIYQGSFNVREHSIAQIKLNNLCMLLRYEDRNSMRHGVESRVPFLDHVLVEHAISLSGEELFAQNRLKGGMKLVFQSVLPSFLNKRKDKVGFTSDMGWIEVNRQHIEKVVFENQDCLEPLINLDRLPSLFDNLAKHRDLVWRLYCFVRWIRIHNVCAYK